MLIEFKKKSRNDHVFEKEVSFVAPDDPCMAPSVACTKESFFYHARMACYELGIVVGYNETPAGYKLGFEKEEDYTALMAIVEPQLMRMARLHSEQMARFWDDFNRKEGTRLPNPWRDETATSEPPRREDTATEQTHKEALAVLTPYERELLEGYDLDGNLEKPSPEEREYGRDYER